MTISSDQYIRRILIVGGVICGLLTALGIGLAAQFWRILPFWDQWAVVELHRTWIERGLTLADLTSSFNEHRIALARLLFLIDYQLFRGTSVFVDLILILSHLALGALLGMLATVGQDAGQRAFAIALSTAFLASPVHIDNLILPFHVSIPLVCILALLAFFWTARAATERLRPGAWTYPILAAAAVVLCPYAMANGLIAAVMAAALAWVLPANWSGKLTITGAAVATVAAYLWTWKFVEPNEPLRASLNSLHGVLDATNHALAFLGSAGQALGGRAAIALGLAGLILWAAAAALLFARRRRGIALDPNLISLFMSATFILATALMIASGRAGGGVGQALSTRYATFSLVFWLSLLGAIWRLAPELGSQLGFARSVVKVTALLLLILAYAAWFRVADIWYARTAASDVVTAELRAGRFDPAHVSLVYPVPDHVRLGIEFLRQQRLSIFAD